MNSSKRRRIYRDPPDHERCQANTSKTLGNDYGRCGRRAVHDGYCQQHNDLAEARVAAAMARLKTT